MKKICKQCGREFELTKGEIDFFKSKGLNLPARCKDCRDKNKNGGSENTQNNNRPQNNTKPTAQYNKPNYVNKPAANNLVNQSGSGFLGSIKAKSVAIIAAVVVLAILAIVFLPKIIADNLDSGNSPTPEVVSSSGNNNVTLTLKPNEANPTTESEKPTAEPTEEAEVTEKAEATTEPTAEPTEEAEPTAEPTEEAEPASINYKFKNSDLLNQHFEKHGIEMGFSSAKEYEAAASAVVNNPDALHKTEADDGDDVYYLEDSNEFVIVSKAGYIRTYFNPSAGKAYYDRQ